MATLTTGTSVSNAQANGYMVADGFSGPLGAAAAFPNGISGSTPIIGALNGTLGATTPNTAVVTTLAVNTSAVISPSGTVAISPTGALTVNPTAASTINNTSIGVTTPAAGKFTTLAATGVTTFSLGNIYTPNAPVAATGSTVTDAAQVNNGYTLVTASDGTKAVKLPAVPTPGMKVTLFNAVAAEPLIIFPDAAATINAIGSHGALTCANGVPVELYATSATQWYSLPLVPS